MRILALAAVALALSACGGDRAADDANVLATDNLMVDDNLMLDANASMNAAGGVDANASTNASTENLMAKDAVTNDPDTNLANGL
ncbi:MAG TPA: hypothetical protein VFP12_10870 [Allosphingosinicella sp.]|nr:hypothetical protein [Allosphingosinicella sp.]